MIAVLLAVRIGEAANPGPWPEDAIGLEAGGWKAVGDGRGLSAAPQPGRTSPFDDPDLQETDDDDCARLLLDDGPLGAWSTAPPSEGDLHEYHSDVETCGDGEGTSYPTGCDGSVGGTSAAGGGRDFYPSATFGGAKAGYCFKLGHLGLGYYLDDGRNIGPGVEQPRAYANRSAVVISLADCIPAAGDRGVPTAEAPLDDDAAPAPTSRSPAVAPRVRVQRTRGCRRKRAPSAMPFVLPRECRRADAAHKAAGLWAVDTINPNAWAGAADHGGLTSADVILAQETRKRGARRADAERQARARGWRFALRDARLTEANRHSAGVGVGVRKHIGVSADDDCSFLGHDGETRYRYIRRWVGAICKGGVHFGSVYCRSAEGLTELNLDILQDVAVDLASVRGPWVLGGDWNVTPEALAASGWLALVDGTVIAPPTPTCNGSVYDYFVVSTKFKQAVVGAAVIEDAQFNPHSAVRLFIAAAPRAIHQRTLVAPRKLAADMPQGCLTEAAATAATRAVNGSGAPSPWRIRADASSEAAAAAPTETSATSTVLPSSVSGSVASDDRADEHLGGLPACGGGSGRGCTWAQWVADAEADLVEVAGTPTDEARKYCGRAQGPRFRVAAAVGAKADPHAGACAVAGEWRSVATWARAVAAAVAATRANGQASRGVAEAAEAARRRLAAMVARHRAQSPPNLHLSSTHLPQTMTSARHAAASATSDGHTDAGPRLAAVQALHNADDPDALWQLAEWAIGRAEAAEQRRRDQNLAEWKRWIKGGPGGGVRRQHQYIKAVHGWVPSKAAARPGMIFTELDDTSNLTPGERKRLRIAGDGTTEPLTTQQEVDSEAGKWAELWDAGRRAAALPWPKELGPMPPRPSLQQLRATLTTFPVGTGLAWDALHPRALLRLSDARLEQLIDLLMAAEAEGRWPPEIAFVTVVLLGKTDGGFRPIGLFPSLVRIWMRLRRDMVARWEDSHDKPYLLAGAGKGADVAAWRQAARAECAAGAGATYGQLLLDLEKAFEVVDHEALVREAVAVGFPLPLLRLSLAAYCLPRALSIEGVYSHLIDPCRGITAGSGMATAELKVLLYRLLAAVAAKHPQVKLSVYVDDVSAEAIGPRNAVADTIIAAGLQLCDGMVRLGLRLSKSGKCNCTSTSDEVGRSIAHGMRNYGVVFLHRVRSLGVGLGAGVRRNAQVQRSRFGKFTQKIRRILALACSGISAARLIQTGGAAVMNFGDDATGVSDSVLLRRRRAVAAAVSRRGKGKDLDVVLAMSDEKSRGGIDPAFNAHTAPIVRWAEAVWGGWIRTQALAKAVDRAKAKLARAKNPWGLVAGPAAATVATAARLGWQLHGAEVMITDRGRRIDLTLDPPVVVKKEVEAAVRRWRWARIVAKHPQLQGGDADGEAAFKPLRSLLRDGARNGAWGPAQQSALRSAITHGQWPQARLRAAGLVDNADCQYCASTASHPGVLPPSGTAVHRVLDCPVVAAIAKGVVGARWRGHRATRSRARQLLGITTHDAGDDPQPIVPSPHTQRGQQQLTQQQQGGRAEEAHPGRLHADARCGERRERVVDDGMSWAKPLFKGHGLSEGEARVAIRDAIQRAWARASDAITWTRGLMTRPVQHDRGHDLDEGTFVWVKRPDGEMPAATFFTDGSVIDQELGTAAVAAWAFTAIDGDGDTIAEAHGIAPAWISCINGAEAWAIREAAMHATPGSTFVTDSLSCHEAIRRGPRRAMHPRNRLARVWRHVFHIFDSASDAALLRWMPAHCTEGQLDHKRCSDGALVTRTEWLGNARADALAKRAALGARAPLAYRAEAAACDEVLRRVGCHLGWTTWAANNGPEAMRRDAVTLTAAQRAERTRRRQAGEDVQRRRVIVKHERSPLLGGHYLGYSGGWWECALCWTRARTRTSIASAKCRGSAAARWAQLEAEAMDVASGRGCRGGRAHTRWMTDDIMWCSTCGAYAEQRAVGLASACRGPPPASGSGRTTSLARLRAGRHPKTGVDLRGVPIPEPGGVKRPSTEDAARWQWGRKQRPPCSARNGAATSSSSSSTAGTSGTRMALASAPGPSTARTSTTTLALATTTAPPTCTPNVAAAGTIGDPPAQAPLATAAQRIAALRERVRQREQHAGSAPTRTPTTHYHAGLAGGSACGARGAIDADGPLVKRHCADAAQADASSAWRDVRVPPALDDGLRLQARASESPARGDNIGHAPTKKRRLDHVDGAPCARGDGSHADVHLGCGGRRRPLDVADLQCERHVNKQARLGAHDDDGAPAHQIFSRLSFGIDAHDQPSQGRAAPTRGDPELAAGNDRGDLQSVVDDPCAGAAPHLRDGQERSAEGTLETASMTGEVDPGCAVASWADRKVETTSSASDARFGCIGDAAHAADCTGDRLMDQAKAYATTARERTVNSPSTDSQPRHERVVRRRLFFKQPQLL